MSEFEDDVLGGLLAGNERHTKSVSADYFAAVQAEQHPDVVTICCSDSRVPQEQMWGVSQPGTVFTPSNIGNQAWDDHEGERIVDGGLLYPIYHTDTGAIAVVGHTGCGAVTAAYHAATGGDLPGPLGVTKWVEMLIPVINDGLESGLIDRDAPESTIINQLVEYNVDYQAQFLHDAAEIPDEVAVYGFVYDFQGVYGDTYGRCHLVNYNGETNPTQIATAIPDQYETVTRSLLYETSER